MASTVREAWTWADAGAHSIPGAMTVATSTVRSRGNVRSRMCLHSVAIARKRTATIASTRDGRSCGDRHRFGRSADVGDADGTVRVERSVDTNRGSALHIGHYIQSPANRARPLFHTDDADAAAVASRGVWIEAAPVVSDCHREVISRPG